MEEFLYPGMRGLAPGLRVDLGLASGVTVGAALLLVYAFQGFYQGYIGDFTNAATPVFAGAATVAAFFSSRKYGMTAKDGFGRAWLMFFVGVASWFAAESAWSFYVFFMNVEVPYPSAADVFFIIGYPFFGGGLLYYIKVFRDVLKRPNIVVTVAVTALAAAVVGVVLIQPVLVSTEAPLPKTFDVLYPVLDVVLFAGAVLGLSIFRRGKLGRSWILLNLAIIFDAVADVVFGYLSAQGTYAYGSAADLGYLWSYLLLMGAFYEHWKEL